MKSSDRSTAGRETQAPDHAGRCLSVDSMGRDEIDNPLADPRADFPPSCRSKVDADRLLRILDELAGGEG